jgi:TP901 family phage tail tape measure protein
VEPIKESIALTLDATGVKANSLAGLITQLKAVEAHITAANAALNGMNFSGPARSAKELEAALLKTKNLNTGAGSNYKYSPLAKALGADDAQIANFEKFVARQKTAVEGYVKSQQAFRNLPQFTRAWAKFEKQTSLSVADLLKPGVSKVTGGTVSGGNIKIDGKIDLVVPGALVNASVSGPISLVIPGSQVSGQMSGGGSQGHAPGTGQFTKGNTAGKKKAKAAKGPLEIAETENELRRVRTETEDSLTEAITVMDEVGNLVTEVHDSVEGIIKTTTKSTTGSTALAQFRALRAAETEKFKQLQAGLGGDTFGFGLAAVQSKQAGQLRAMLSPELAASLGPVASADIAGRLGAAADTLEAKAAATRSAAEAARQADTNARIQNALKGRFKQMVGIDLRGGKLASESAQIFQQLFGNTPPPGFHAGTAREDFTGLRYGSPAARPGLGGLGVFDQGGGGRDGGRGGRGPWGDYIDVDSEPVPPGAAPKPPKKTPMEKALEGFTPMGFATHLVKVTGWAAAVGVLYKTLELASYSMHRFIATTEEMAHLNIVFKGVGGTSRQLADDVMQLAAANGRSTEEAMASATEWARLGLTRVQVNEAVAVSMQAANVAMISSEEATERLSGLMHTFHLSVSDLPGVLGQLTNSSLKYNVGVGDLLDGLSRVATVARQSGMGLAELQGMLAATIGHTGQSGVTVANTVKSVITQFSNPNIQKMLRGYGIETTTKSGGIKSSSELLRESFIKYQGMDPRTQQDFTRAMAGRYGASRMAGMFDSYLEGQKLAIDGELHLGAAMTANTKIVATMKAELAGVRSEWDRLLVNKLMPDLTPLVRLLKNSLAYANLPSAVRGANDETGLFGLPGQSQNQIDRENKVSMLQARDWVALRRKQGLSSGLWSHFVHGFLGGVLHPNQSDEERGQAFSISDLMAANVETPLDRTKESFQQAVQAHFGAANADRLGAKAFDALRQVLPLKTKDSGKYAEAGAGFMDQLGIGDSAAFKKMLAGGDVAGAQKMLGDASRAAELKSMQEADAGVAATTQRLTEIQNDSTMSVEEKTAAIKDATSAQDAQTQALEDEAGELIQAIARRQEYTDLLKEQADVLQLLNDLGSQQTMDTAGSKNDAAVQALEQQKAQLEFTQKRLRDQGLGLEGIAPWDQTVEQLSKVNAELASRTSPQMQAGLDLLDNRAIYARRATQEATAAGVGYTDTEKLLNEKNYLTGEIGKTAGNPNASEDELVRAKQMQIELGTVQQSLDERRVILLGQQKQILIDSAREYQKSLLFAGPGELLQKLYVGARAARGPISAGEFMSWGTDSRQTYYQMRGGDAGAKTREELGQLDQSGYGNVTPGQEAAEAKKNREDVKQWGARIGAMTTGKIGDSSGMPLPNLDALDKQALTTTASLNLLGNSANAAAAALAKIAALVPGGSSRTNAPAAKSFDISAGHALGSAPAGNVNVPGADRSFIDRMSRVLNGLPWGG